MSQLNAEQQPSVADYAKRTESENLVYRVGDFEVSLSERTLTQNGQEVTIEPKVFDVLSYFCLNHERYILTQELHDQVWQGRMVSDAAVRRSVSKLRIILGDNTKDPKYIKSGSKRGYKLICDVQLQTEGASSFQSTSNASLETKPEVRKQQKSKNVLIFLASLLLLLASVSVYFLVYNQNTSYEQVPETTVLIDYIGEKRFIDATPGAEKVAFTARMPGFSGFQVFFKNMDSNKVDQITNTPNSVLKFDFSIDQKFLFFIDIMAGATTLNKLYLDDPLKPVEIIVSDFYYLSDLAVSNDGKGLYFNGLKSLNMSSQLYFLDFTTLKIRALTRKLNEDFHDNKVAVSHDAKKLAYVTVMGKVGEQRISVAEVSNQRVINRFYHDKAIYQLEWFDDNSLLILDETGVFRINIDTKARTQVFENVSKTVKSISVYEPGKMVLLNNPPKANFFTELNLVAFSPDAQHIISTDKDIEQMLYTEEENKKLVIKRNGKAMSVSTLIGDEEFVHLETSASLEVFEASSHGQLILAKIDNMLALIDTQTNKITYITGSTQFLAQDATFSYDHSAVLYGEKTREGWIINSYDIASKSIKVLLEGYKSVRAYRDGYILADKSDQLYQYRREDQSITSIDVAFSADFKTRWLVRGSSIYWTVFDAQNTVFSAFDFVLQEQRSYPLEAIRIDPSFDIDPLGHRLLLKNRPFINTEILKASY